MQAQTHLRLIKLLHTLIWVFFNIIFYLVYAVLVNKIDKWVLDFHCLYCGRRIGIVDI